MRDFIDIPHQVSSAYEAFYDALGEESMDDAARDKLRAFIKLDPDYLIPYLMLANYYNDHGEMDACRDILQVGYDRALKLILDWTGRWPERMELRHRRKCTCPCHVGFLWQVVMD